MLRYRFSFPLWVTYFAFLFSLFASYFTAFASVQDDIDIIIDECKARYLVNRGEVRYTCYYIIIEIDPV